jgi:GNAT superfamily N-acetyltransferase
MAITYQWLALSDNSIRNRIGFFLREESKSLDYVPGLFDEARWFKCDEVYLAEDNGSICGFVTIAVNGIGGTPRPTVDTLYVPTSHRSKGLGSYLLETGIRRLLERKPDCRVYCDLQNSAMERLVAKLPDELRQKLDTA